METLKSDRWLARPDADSRGRCPLRLFCFPYAGGGVEVYAGWAAALQDVADVCPVQLPGRGVRLREPAFTELGALVAAVSSAIAPWLDRPFALFGHSMGATIAFQLARSLTRRGCPPTRLFVSGCGAPRPAGGRQRARYALPDPEFIQELRRLNGTPREVLENPELMKLLLPTLRADFTICDTCGDMDGDLIDSPITAIGGERDTEAPPERVAAWSAWTTGPFHVHRLNGDHFYINSLRPQVQALVRTALCPVERTARVSTAHQVVSSFVEDSTGRRPSHSRDHENSW